MMSNRIFRDTGNGGRSSGVDPEGNIYKLKPLPEARGDAEITETDLEELIRILKPLAEAHGITKIDVKIVHEHKYFVLDPAMLGSREYGPKPLAVAKRSAVEDVDDDEKDLLRWRSELSHFEEIRGQLWKDKQFRNKYVAIRRRRVIDVDGNKFELVRRTARLFPDEVVFIGKVQISIPVVRLPSPRLKA